MHVCVTYLNLESPNILCEIKITWSDYNSPDLVQDIAVRWGKVNIIYDFTSASGLQKKSYITKKHLKQMLRYTCSKLAKIQDSRWHWQHARVKRAVLNGNNIDHIISALSLM